MIRATHEQILHNHAVKTQQKIISSRPDSHIKPSAQNALARDTNVKNFQANRMIQKTANNSPVFVTDDLLGIKDSRREKKVQKLINLEPSMAMS